MERPSCRATQLVAFRSTLLNRFGPDGWRRVAEALEPDLRDRLVPGGLVLANGWVAEADMLDFSEVVLASVCDGDETLYREVVGGAIDEGFGRIRRVLVGFASPKMILGRAPELWRHDHTHGRLEVSFDGSSATVRVEHPVLSSTRLACLTAAEMFRHIIALTRVTDVVATHTREANDTLRVVLRWSAG